MVESNEPREELLTVLEAHLLNSQELISSEMKANDCKKWLIFAEQKETTYKSGRPELLQDGEKFR